MSKPERIPQDTIDAVVGLERKYGDGHHSFELRDGIFALILAAKAEEREACVKVCLDELQAAKANGAMQEAMGAHWCAAAIRKRGEVS